MATKGCERLLPLPCGTGKHRPVECLRATLAAIVAAHSTPTQSTTTVMEPDNPDPQAVDSSPTRITSLSSSSFPRHSSKVGAVCVEAPVRFCAGAISDDRPYRDQWVSIRCRIQPGLPQFLCVDLANQQRNRFVQIPVVVHCEQPPHDRYTESFRLNNPDELGPARIQWCKDVVVARVVPIGTGTWDSDRESFNE